jgi:hypothetical protein
MSFVDQWILAKEMGFKVPARAVESIGLERTWIGRWEAEYAKL